MRGRRYPCARPDAPHRARMNTCRGVTVWTPVSESTFGTAFGSAVPWRCAAAQSKVSSAAMAGDEAGGPLPREALPEYRGR